MNNDSNDSSSKRKRRQRSSLSLSSSVSSVSSGGSDSSFNKSRRSKNNSKDNNNKSGSNNGVSKSFFSGFWSDAEIDDNENSTGSRSNSNNNRNGGNNEGRIYYEGFYLTIGDTIYDIGVGDVVAMRNSIEPVGHESGEDNRKRQEPMPASEYTADTQADKPSDFYKSPEKDAPIAKTAVLSPRKGTKLGDGLMLARVERIWQDTTKRRRGSTSTSGTNTTNSNSSGMILFQARWFLKKEDVDSLPLGELTGPVSSEVFANNITEHDLVLSNQSDDNHVTTICDLVQGEYMESNGMEWNEVEAITSHNHIYFLSSN